MELLHFRTNSPTDHIPRALDILRKMGFELQGLAAERGEADRFFVSLHYRRHGVLSSQTFFERLALIDGLTPCAVPRDMPAAFLQTPAEPSICHAGGER